ncbi:MAG: protein translocase subunit SecF [Campylobacteraceae bacterium]|jgi:preprotein translocase subunit SecF|nr:protein translocase subunit SecF [Campylobacteraceae bacterium]
MIAISAILSIMAIALFFIQGLNYGIDFAGGTDAKIKYKEAAPIEKIRTLTNSDPLFHGASVTEFGSKEEVTIRFSGSTEVLGEDVGDKLHELLKDTGEFEIRQIGMVGPKVGAELRKKGLTSIIISLIVILIYIAIRFEWRFGIAAIISEIHDVLLILGIIVVLRIDVNLEILAAVLTLLAYSLNDTIVVFDRIRDEIKKSKSSSLADIIDLSVSKTLSRTILTSLTTLFVIFALLVFGGESIKGFALTLFIGVIIGTYSSVFIAAPLLKWLKFDITTYKANIAKKEKAKLEKERMRSMYEKGIV